jgi:hypothetical protein
MTETRPSRPHAEVARGQHKELARTTAVRIERYTRQVVDDIDHDRPVSVAALTIAQAALTLLTELTAITTRDEIAARGSAHTGTAAEAGVEVAPLRPRFVSEIPGSTAAGG